MEKRFGEKESFTEKQKRFCEEYVVDLNATQAAIRAGYSKRSAKVLAVAALTKANVQTYISELQRDIQDRNKLKADDVIQELRALSFWNAVDFIDEGNVIKDLTKLPRELTKAVVGIKVKQTFLPNPNGEGEPIEEITTELKMVDKRGALVDLGKHLGVFEKDNRQKAPVKIRVKSNNTQNNFGENK
jgi:phage terminase small subunit